MDEYVRRRNNNNKTGKRRKTKKIPRKNQTM